jgi:hypothetical protein
MHVPFGETDFSSSTSDLQSAIVLLNWVFSLTIGGFGGGGADETMPCLYTKTHISYLFPMHIFPFLLIPSETLQISFPASFYCF